jgi:hypothetical protein
MIFRKFCLVIAAWCNSLVNWMRSVDPVAEMQLECDRELEKMKKSRLGLERQRALVERVSQQVVRGDAHIQSLKAEVVAYKEKGDRETAGRFALEVEEAEKQMGENREQLRLHEESYNNNLLKMGYAKKKIAEAQKRADRKENELKTSQVDAEIAVLTEGLDFDVSTDFSRAEKNVDDQIAANRGMVRVAADVSGQGIETIKHAQAVEKAKAEEALRKFEESTTKAA